MALKVKATLEDAAADVDFESKVRKIGYTTTNKANVASLFSRSVPAFLESLSPSKLGNYHLSRQQRPGNQRRWLMEPERCWTELWTQRRRSCRAYWEILCRAKA
jgi:hypothetical protein